MSKPTNAQMRLPDGTVIEPSEVRRLRPIEGDGHLTERWELVFPFHPAPADATLDLGPVANNVIVTSITEVVLP